MKPSTCVHAVTSVVSNSLQPHGLYPTRVLCLWGSPGKNTGMKWSESHSVMSNSLRPHGLYSPWILQARILAWDLPFSRGFSQPRDWTQVSHIADGFFTSWATGILEGVAISSSGGSSWPRDWICVSCMSCVGRWILYHRSISFGSPNHSTVLTLSFFFFFLTQWFHREVFSPNTTYVCPMSSEKHMPRWDQMCKNFKNLPFEGKQGGKERKGWESC